MNKKEIRSLNERIASDKVIQTLSTEAQFDIFEKMLELEGLQAIDQFECIPSTDLFLDPITEENNKWEKVNASICEVHEVAVSRKFQEVPFAVIQSACKALRCIRVNFPNEREETKVVGLTEIHTA